MLINLWFHANVILLLLMRLLKFIAYTLLELIFIDIIHDVNRLRLFVVNTQKLRSVGYICVRVNWQMYWGNEHFITRFQANICYRTPRAPGNVFLGAWACVINLLPTERATVNWFQFMYTHEHARIRYRYAATIFIIRFVFSRLSCHLTVSNRWISFKF